MGVWTVHCSLFFVVFSCYCFLTDFRYRAFSTDHRSKPAAGFVDGDLLERFVDLPRDKMESVAMETKVCAILHKPCSVDDSSCLFRCHQVTVMR